VQVDLTFVELRRGDRLLLCSDGLSGLLHIDTLRTTLDELKDPAECSAKLIEYAETAGGHDNITVVVADFGGDGLPEPTDGDSFGYVQYPLPMADHESSAFTMGETVRVGRRVRAKDEAAPGKELADEAQEHGDSLLPMAPRAGDKRANTLWIIGGLLALAFAALVWIRVQPTLGDDAQEGFRASPKPALAPSAAATSSETADPIAVKAVDEPEAIEVNIHTDVEQATLLVNGEPKGELSPEQSRSLKLRPGAYRFEAQAAGSPVAASVVTVRGDMPLDVFLQLPKGASEGANVGGARAVAPESAAVVRAPEPERPRAAGVPAEPTPAVSQVPGPSLRRPRAKSEHDAQPLHKRRERPRANLPTGAEANAQHGTEAAGTSPKPPEIPDNPF
jgi:hypothetical protein